MTIRGFLAWYLTTVAMVGVSGAALWQGIQTRKQMESIVAVAPQAPAPVLAEVESRPPVTAPAPAALPTPRPQQSSAATALPAPPLRPAPPAGRGARVASSALSRSTSAQKPRPAARTVARAPSYRYPPAVAAQGAGAYPGYGPGSYVVAAPPVVVAPWQTRRYSYYYPYYGYYVRYPYYSAY